MALIVKLGLHLICLGAIAFAIPVSLIEDIKDAQLQSPLRTNKVKRAQEVLMFGNQQNRAMNNYANQRAEKRDVGDNSLSDDVATLPNLLPQVEDQNYETNQIGSVDKAYPYIGADPAYGLVLRNAALKESLRNEPVLSYGDLSLYNMVDARRKRDVPKPTPSYSKMSFRSKRDYDLSPEELVSLLKMLESQRKPSLARFREQSDNVWPLYTPDNEDFDLLDNQEENEVDNESDYNRGVWMNGPVPMGSGQQDGHLWPRKLKRFMVSKRRADVDNLSQINLPYDFPEGLPLQRRFIL